MQEHRLGGEVGPRAASWYLARGDKRYGPLADRELLLLAERGGLRTDDLLWKPGFTSWKPVHAVCGVKLSSEIVTPTMSEDAESLPAGEPSDQPTQVEMTDAADGGKMAEPKPSLKARLDEEVKRFLIIFAYLWLVFLVFLVHEWIVLADNHIGFRFYGLAAINAFVLFEMLLFAEELGFAVGLYSGLLVVSIIYNRDV